MPWRNGYQHTCCGVGIRWAVANADGTADWEALLKVAFPRSRRGYVTMISLPIEIEEQARHAWRRRGSWQICGRNKTRFFVIICNEVHGGNGKDPDTFDIKKLANYPRPAWENKERNLRAMKPLISDISQCRDVKTLYLHGYSSAAGNQLNVEDHIEALTSFFSEWKPDPEVIYHTVLAGDQEAVAKPILEKYGWKRVVLTRNPNTYRRIAVYVPGGQLVD